MTVPVKEGYDLIVYHCDVKTNNNNNNNTIQRQKGTKHNQSQSDRNIVMLGGT